MEDLLNELEPPAPEPEERQRRRRLLGAIGIAGLSLVTLGTLTTGAVFSDADDLGANSFTTGTVLIGTTPATALFTVANMAPGDTEYRSLNVVNQGTLDLRYAVTSTATDPDSKGLRALIRIMAKALGRSYVFLPLPLPLVRAAVSLPFVGRTLGLIPESIAYFGQRCRYDASQAKADLATLGLACPAVETYIDIIVRFFRANRDSVRKTAMV